MRKLFVAVSLLAQSAIGCTRTELVPSEPSDAIVTEDGAFRLTVSDELSSMGLALVLPVPEGLKGEVRVVGLRYGSTCNTEVTGYPETTGHAITITISYMPRLASCTKEVRLLRYKAEVLRLPPGEYDVTVVHKDGASNTNGVISRRHVIVS